MDEKLKKVLDKVAKLRALSQSQNANEAAAAAAQAARLIDEYNISEAELEAAAGEKKESARAEEDPVIRATGKTNVIPQWKIALIGFLGHHFGVYVLRQYDKVVLSGRPSDVEVVRYFYTWISAEIERLALKAGAEYKERTRAKAGVAWYSTYRNGAARGVGLQLSKLKTEMRKETSSTALVVLDGRHDEAKNARLAVLDPNTKIHDIKTNWGSRPDAYMRGLEDGKNIHLGKHLASGDGSVIRDNKQLGVGAPFPTSGGRGKV